MKIFSYITKIWRTVSRDQRGFTLFEMLVALLLFSIIIIIGSAAFMRGMELNRRGASVQRIQENALFVLETIAREIRYSILHGANDYDCVNSFASTLTINHPVNGTVSYWVANNIIQRSVGGETGALSSNDVSFEKFAFCIMGSGSNKKQTRITIIARVRDALGGLNSPAFDLQTTIALRNLSEEP